MPNNFHLQLEGHLGKDPVFDTTSNGKAQARFSLSVTKKVKDKENKTAWFFITAYGETTISQCRALHKGSPALVEVNDPTCIRCFKGNRDGQETLNIAITAFKVLAINWQKQEAAPAGNTEETLSF